MKTAQLPIIISGLGVTWKGSQAEGVVLFERVNEKLTTLKRNPKDMWRVTAGGNWKLQSFTTYLSLCNTLEMRTL